MNVTASNTQITKTVDSSTSTSAVSSSNNIDGDSKTFKEELVATANAGEKVSNKGASQTATNSAQSKVSESKHDSTQNNNINASQTAKTNSTAAQNSLKTEQAKKEVSLPEVQEQAAVVQNNVVQNNVSAVQTAKSGSKTDKSSKNDETSQFSAVAQLKSELETINSLKQTANTSVNKTSAKISQQTVSKTSDDYCKRLKMDDKDVSFFLNLVDSQQMTAQASQLTGAAADVNSNFTEIKSEATQQPVQVSTVLMNALNDSATTGKSVRIDFDDNIAVVMKLDKNGAISANFIPGDAAVENYLRNNIATLQQNFDNKNLPYNELTYSNRQKQEQQRRKNKEQENE